MVSRLFVKRFVLLALVFQQALSAHAILIQSTPKQDSTVVGPKISVALKFNSRIDSKRSSLSLLLPTAKVEGLKLADQAEPDSLVAQPADLAPGKYRLRWQVLATDGHITRGEFGFTVQ